MSFAGDDKDKSKAWVTSVKYIDQATVPVVKVECSLSALMDS
jgi:hypothetical protein